MDALLCFTAGATMTKSRRWRLFNLHTMYGAYTISLLLASGLSLCSDQQQESL